MLLLGHQVGEDSHRFGRSVQMQLQYSSPPGFSKLRVCAASTKHSEYLYASIDNQGIHGNRLMKLAQECLRNTYVSAPSHIWRRRRAVAGAKNKLSHKEETASAKTLQPEYQTVPLKIEPMQKQAPLKTSQSLERLSIIGFFIMKN